MLTANFTTAIEIMMKKDECKDWLPHLEGCQAHLSACHGIEKVSRHFLYSSIVTM
jgi:hypothetical protein